MTRPWRVSLLVLVAVTVLLVLGGAWLFGGSEVDCEESLPPSGPRLRCAFDVAVPVGEVWTAFTGTGEPRPYYFDAILEAEMRPRGRWRFLTDDRARLLAGGQILRIEPPYRFEHTFEAADLDDPASRIRVELRPAPGGCRVDLIHDRFERRTRTYRRFRRAHPLALSAMKAMLENGELPFRTRVYTALFKPGMKTLTVSAEPWSEE